MIRQLAQCPYCQGCEIALTDSFDLLFNPESSTAKACPHLIWVEGRYTQWGLSPLPGRKTKIARMIGSNEFEWFHPEVSGGDDTEPVRRYFKLLIESGADWPFAPPEAHQLRFLSVNHQVTDANGKEYPDWEVEGTALFAANPAAFVQSLPACLEKQNATWTDFSDLSPG